MIWMVTAVKQLYWNSRILGRIGPDTSVSPNNWQSPILNIQMKYLFPSS